ncbi:hypothetical protein CROQUDRAFT_657836 [Cronartium quercuum f. sp. fusiforme G11]|uniref:Uncharacterized protein n=1 Tax=Cronartium quercuum f. sp. fusiforme G11 TaxID=708437 RepID=A0A9P6TCW7_9BASI|nr:hypothetical protein CROQUDRAFT_657836 [Cronartium quercuum f. sp. fusiforme G11]
MNSTLSKLYSNLNFERPTGDEPIQGHIGYTSFQSGFTVDVKCQLLPAGSNSTEIGNLYTVFEGNISLPDTTHLSLWRFHSQCPSRAPTNFTRFLRPTGSMIVSDTCKDQDFLGHDVPGSHLLLLAGKGARYSFIKPRVCQFTPFYTIVETEYNTSIKSIKVIKKDPVTNTTANAARIFYKGLLLAASMYPSDSTDRLGDDVLSLLEIGRLLGHLSDSETTEDILVNRIFEKYFQGMIEAFATVIRTPPISIVKSQLNFTSIDALPRTWTSIISGNWSYQTLGWHSSAGNFRSTTIAIIPILLVTLSSMLLAIVSWKTLRQASYHTDEPFDPNDLVTLLKASSDGSLGDKLSPKTPSGQIKVVEIQIELRRMPCQWELHAVNSF